MNHIDFRSDTVTWPTEAMRSAMANAPVGDDVYGEDPTVNELEQTAADMLGQESALFVTSGTQGNLIAMLSHTNRGDEVIMGEEAHTFMWEAGGAAVLGGLTPRPLPLNDLGQFNLAQVEAVIRPDNPHLPHSRLINTENTAGGKFGAAVPPTYFAQLRHIADQHQLAIHLDGARLFNATTALGVTPTDITQYVDSVTICLSKGLCAPVGSVLAGSKTFIHRARRARKLLGGGMRQAGVLAAAGLIALREMTQRLAEDHYHAQLLAQGLAQIPAIHIDPLKVHTNMVFFDLQPEVNLTPDEINQRLLTEYNIRLGGYGRQGFRAVTHYWIQKQHVELLIEGLKNILH